MALDRKNAYFLGFRSSLFYVSFPIELLTHQSVLWFQDWKSAVNENKVLKQELVLLREKQLLLSVKLQKFALLQSENARLRALLSATPMSKENLLVADVLQVASDPFVHQLTINKGKASGVFVGQPVIDDKGVVGVVIQTNRLSSRVLLAIDASCSIPIKNLRNSVRAISIGRGVSRLLELQYVPVTVDFKEGDKLVTSGLGDQYPAGYLVGFVSKVERDPAAAFSTVLITPSARLDRNRQVLLLSQQKEQKQKNKITKAENEKD